MSTHETIDVAEPPCEHCEGPTVEQGRPALYDCPACFGEQLLKVRTHAVDRWVVRAETDDVPDDEDFEAKHCERRQFDRLQQQVRDAWTEGISLVPDTTTLTHDELRYHRPTETILLRRNLAIVTVIHAPTSHRSIREGVVQAMVAHRVDSDVIASTCEYFDVDTEQFQAIVEQERARERQCAGQGEGSASGAVAPGRNPHSVASADHGGG